MCVTKSNWFHCPSFQTYTPLFKSNRNIFFSVKRWYLFSMYRFEIFHIAWWSLLLSLWKISWVYVIASRLCEHSNLVRSEKRAAKTLQHVYRYGDILMLYDIITAYEWFFCYNWHKLCSNNKLVDFSSTYYFLVKYAIWISNMNEHLPHPLLCWYATSGAGGLRSENQLILDNAMQYSDVKFLNISRYGLGRTDLFPDLCGYGLYDVPPTHVDTFLLSNSGYSFYLSLSVH